MSQIFPSLPDLPPENIVIGPDFDMMKRNPLRESFVGYNQKVFKFTDDRLIPSRRNTTTEFLKKTRVDTFDVSTSENGMKTMKKIQYQNQLRKLFLEQQDDKKEVSTDKENERKEVIKLLHQDWACKVPDARLKFLPDFETLKKPGFGYIHTYIWSNKEIIAACSRRKICLYHPFNGFTRALDITDHSCIAFANSGDFLAMAYKKSRRPCNEQDLFVFRIDHKTLFDSENLDTEKVRTQTPHDITALCYTQNDDYLMCGTDVGKILILECIPPKHFDPASPTPHKWLFVKLLSSSFHKHDIKKISFSAKFRYMASLDSHGQLVIWNGGSWTQLFCLQKENSRLYKHLEWHPFVEEELIFGKSIFPALYLINVVQKQVVACYMNWKEDMEITSIAFNPITAQLAVCFYMREEYVNRVSILASMSQVINTFDFDYIYGGLKLFWNSSGTMLGAGAQCFRFAFWSFHKNRDFPPHMIKGSTSKNPALFTLNDSKLSSLR